MNMDLYITTVSFVGCREINEDNFLVDDKFEVSRREKICICEDKKMRLNKPRIFAVSDGMGGLSNGDLASMTVIEQLFKHKNKLLSGKDCWDKINKSVLNLIRKKGAPCGATLSACVLENYADTIIANTYTIGDSPIYLYSDEEKTVKLINILDNEAYLNQKEMTEKEQRRAKCILHHFFGKEYGIDRIPVHKDSFEAKKGDVIIIASDGLTTIDEEKIQEIIINPKYTNLSLALATSAIEHSDEYCDNTTVIAIEIM